MSSPHDGESARQGRSDPHPRLADRLSGAPPAYLEGALENPALNEDLVVILLRNRNAPADLLRRLHEDPRFRRSAAVRFGLVCHPRTPRSIAMNLVPFLTWRDLALAADHVLAPPPVRRSALRYLEQRFDDLTQGEQTFLARTGGRMVLGALSRGGNAPVIREAMRNPRLTEDDLVEVCSARATPPEVLELVARSARWTRRYRIRQALVHHEAAPMGVLLGLLTGLLRADLEEVARRRDRPPLVRLAARRVLRRRYGGKRTPHPEVHELDGEETEASR
jgi:hypothetical protein